MIPVALRVHLAHAAVQAIAEECGAELLHVKGPAVDPVLLRRSGDPIAPSDGGPLPLRLSTDADVLVRPPHLSRFLAALRRHGWVDRTRFHTGSAFEHAACLWHDDLGWVDVHRSFPGLQRDPAASFDALWRDRHPFAIAGRPCPVPSLDAQRLLLLLHAARSGGSNAADVDALWTAATDAERRRTEALAGVHGAEVPLAAVTGRLADYADRRDHDLWRRYSSGETGRLTEWHARLKAARNPLAATRVAVSALFVNTDHLALRLGRPPTRREVAAEDSHRARRAAREVADHGRALGARLRARIGRRP